MAFSNSLDAVFKYFPTGTAEGERKLLEQVFITPQQMESVMSAPAGSPRILVGTKGSGKSAIASRIHDAALANDVPLLLLRPRRPGVGGIGNATGIAITAKAIARSITQSRSCSSLENLSVIVTVRSEVWLRLQRDEKGRRLRNDPQVRRRV